MSNRNDVFEQLLKSISISTGKSEQEIAISLKRNAGYIAQLRSRMKKGDEVPQKFIDLMRLHYAKEVPGIEMEGVVIKASKKEELAALTAAIKIIAHELSDLRHIVTGESRTEIYLRFESMIEAARKKLEG